MTTTTTIWRSKGIPGIRNGNTGTYEPKQVIRSWESAWSLSLDLLVYSELILMRFAISYSVLYSNTGWSMYMRLYR